MILLFYLLYWCENSTLFYSVLFIKCFDRDIAESLCDELVRVEEDMQALEPILR